MWELLLDPQTYISLIILTSLEIVLGIDNILFISIITSRLPKVKQELARKIGLSAALFGRLALLFSLSLVMSLTKPLFVLFSKGFSGRDLVLGIGGLFLLYKATQEIFFHLEEAKEVSKPELKNVSMTSAITQILILDLVFSLDSIITAIGLVSHLSLMAIAIIIAVIIMLFSSNYISNFLNEHPSMKILGLSFLLLVGVLLIAECFGQHISRGYIYFSLSFSTFVEWLNIVHKKRLDKTKTAR